MLDAHILSTAVEVNSIDVSRLYPSASSQQGGAYNNGMRCFDLQDTEKRWTITSEEIPTSYSETATVIN